MSGGDIATVGELLAHAHAMELEAQERYEFLARQMETHNNRELARLFQTLARVEGKHAREIEERMKGMDVPEIGPLDFRWEGAESPEALDLGDMDYLMSPRRALLLALAAEQRAHAFFAGLLERTADEGIRRFAAEFAEEEREHVDRVHRELRKYPEEDDRRHEDMDPAGEG